jgi:hypothetical protein
LIQQLLVAAQFDVAFEFLSSEATQHLDSDTVERTIESAALEYFDSAGGIEDQRAMDMCLKCLSMRPGSNFARSIRDLVEALRLLSAMGLKNRLPAEVRRENDKIQVLRWVFEVNPQAYKNLASHSRIDLPRPPGTTLFRLAQLLGLVSDVQRASVRVLIAEYAMKGSTKFDLDVAYRMCNHLLRDSSSDIIKTVQAWRVCASLATDSRFTDFQARRELCSFALLHCHDDDGCVEKLIEMWREMDMLRDMEHGIQVSKTLSTTRTTYDQRQGSKDKIVQIVRSEISKLNRHVLDRSSSPAMSHPFYIRKRSSGVDQLRSFYPTAGLLSGRKRGLGLTREIVEVRRKLRQVLLSWQGSTLRNNIKFSKFSSIISSKKATTRSLSKLMSDVDQLLDSGCDEDDDEEEEEEEITEEKDDMSMWYESLHILARDTLEEDSLESLALLVSAAGVNPIDAMRCPLSWQTELRAEADLERVLTSEEQSEDRWNTTVSYTKLALGLCALEILARKFSHINIEDHVSVSERIGAVISLYNNNDNNNNTEFPSKDDKTPFVNALRFWSRQYKMCNDAEEIEKIKSEPLNKELFVLPQCHAYREKMCLSLACTTNKKQIKRAVEIGQMYGLTESNILVRHLIWLLQHGRGNELQQAYQTKLLKIPSDFANDIQNQILPSVRGTDHESLQIVMSMLLSCITVMREKNIEFAKSIEISEKELKSHQHLLKRISSIAPGLNYKRVMGSECGYSILGTTATATKEFDESLALRAIVEVATNRNISNLAKEVKFMQREFKITQNLSPEKLFRVYCENVLDCGGINGETYKRCRGYLKRMGTKDLVCFVRYVVFSCFLTSESEIGDLAVRDAKNILSDRETVSKEFDWLVRTREAIKTLKDVSDTSIVTTYVNCLRNEDDNVQDIVDDMIFDSHVCVQVVNRFVCAMYNEMHDDGETRVAKRCRMLVETLTAKLSVETENITKRLDALLRFASDSDVVSNMVAEYLQSFVDKEIPFRVQEIVLRLMKEYGMLKNDQTDRLVSVCVEQKIQQVFKDSTLAARVGDATKSVQNRDHCFETMIDLAHTNSHFKAIAYVLRAWCLNSVDDDDDESGMKDEVTSERLELAVTWLLRNNEENQEKEREDRKEQKWWETLLVRAAKISLFEFVIHEQRKGLQVSIETELKLANMLQTQGESHQSQLFRVLSSHSKVRETVFNSDLENTSNDELRFLVMTRTRALSWNQNVLSWIVKCSDHKKLDFVVCWTVSALCISGRVVLAGEIVLKSSRVHRMFQNHPRASLIMLKPFLSSKRRAHGCGVPVRLIDEALKMLEKLDVFLRK